MTVFACMSNNANGSVTRTILNLESFGLPYSRKYWRELNLAVGSQMAIAKALADFNLAVRYGIAIRIYVSRKFWRILIWRLSS